ncbi:MAG TPA: sulfatase [Porticoccaceae bacterium]|nr:sulfatase [Porticoccaceae bacterium]
MPIAFNKLIPLLLVCLVTQGCDNPSGAAEDDPNKTQKPPNIVFILTDDQNYDTLQALGNPNINTPNLDKLVRSGVSFTHVFNQGSWEAAVCGPSRKMLNTGRHLYRTGYGPSTAEADLFRAPLMGEIFQNYGYETFVTGKWHIDEESLRRSFSLGSDIFMPLYMGMSFQEDGGQFYPLVADYDGDDSNSANFATRRANKFSNDLFVDSAIDYLAGKANDATPFFMYVSFLTPHDPRQAPAAYLEMYPPATMPLPVNMLPEHPFDEGDHNVRDEVLLPFPRTEMAVKWYISQYYAMISHLDAQIGRLIAQIEASEFAENTVIVFTSDNGLANGQHGLLGKQNQYDHSVRVPLVIAGPKIDNNVTKKGMFYLHSVLPTLLDLANIPKPDSIDSASAAPLLSGTQDVLRESIYGAYKNFQRMVRTDTHKLIYYPILDKTQLFDMVNDPFEMNDLSDNPSSAKVIQELMHELEVLKREVGDPLNNDDPVASFHAYKKDWNLLHRFPRRDLYLKEP